MTDRVDRVTLSPTADVAVRRLQEWATNAVRFVDRQGRSSMHGRIVTGADPSVLIGSDLFSIEEVTSVYAALRMLDGFDAAQDYTVLPVADSSAARFAVAEQIDGEVFRVRVRDGAGALVDPSANDITLGFLVLGAR